MTQSRFGKANKFEASTDDESRLYCTHSGCRRRWSVMIDKPKCSAHQWEKLEDYAAIPFDPLDTSIPNDGKQWARRIIKAHEQGFNVRPISLKFARQALRLEVQA